MTLPRPRPAPRRHPGWWLVLVLLLAWLPAARAAAAPFIRAADPTDATAALEPPPPPPPGWISVDTPLVTVHADEHDRDLARRLARHATEALPRLADELGVAIGPTIHVYAAPSDRLFESMQPGRVPAWADGTAWPHRGLVYLHAPRARPGTAAPLETVLDHELVHVLLGRAFGPRPVPRWLQEGLAQLLAREYTPEQTRTLAHGVFGGNLLAIEDMTGGFPADPLRARLAYAESADLVAYVQNRFGREAIHVLVREMARGAPAGAAIRRATGLSIGDLDAAWRGRLERGPFRIAALADGQIFLGLAGIVFAVAAVFALRRRRRRLEAWAREEAELEARLAREREAPLLRAALPGPPAPREPPTDLLVP